MIKVDQITKKYGAVIALNDVSLYIDTGKIVCLVGPNGSGKSTLIKIILGLTSPNTGNILLDDSSISIGYLTELTALPAGYSGNDILIKLELLQGIQRSDSVMELIRLFGMSDFLFKKVKGYSKGMQKKLGLLTAFSGEPDLVILDEPFEGIDTIDRDKLSTFIKNYVSTRKSVILSTHILYELDQLCDTAHFLKSGKLITSFDPKSYSFNGSFEFNMDFDGSEVVESISNPTITNMYRRIYQ